MYLQSPLLLKIKTRGMCAPLLVSWTTSTSTMTLDVYERQVPLQPMFDYVDSPSTTTTIACQVRLHGDASSTSTASTGSPRTRTSTTCQVPLRIAKFIYHVYHYCRPEHLRTVYNYRRRVPLLPLPSRERLLPLRPSTTTSTTDARTTTSPPNRSAPKTHASKV